MNHRFLFFPLGLILIAIGIAASMSFLQPLHSSTMPLSWGVLGLPIGILLILGPRYARVTRVTLRVVAALTILVSLVAAVAVITHAVPLSPEFAITIQSPWFWVQTGASTVLVAGAIWVGGDFIARLAEVTRGGTSTAAG